jgi:hypothetical protein
MLRIRSASGISLGSLVTHTKALLGFDHSYLMRRHTVSGAGEIEAIKKAPEGAFL